MSYRLSLTDAELSTLGWAVDRGYFPQESFDAMTLVSEAPDGWPDQEAIYEIPEHAAWAILEWCGNNADLYACIGQPLLDKLLKLEEEIV